MLDYIYDGNSDHMGYEMLKEFKQTHKDLGYIKFAKEDNEWYAYIIKELDF